MAKIKPTEVFTRFSTVVEELTDAWVFVMEHTSLVGPYPSVEINSCFTDEECSTFDHYHVAVFGATSVPNGVSK